MRRAPFLLLLLLMAACKPSVVPSDEQLIYARVFADGGVSTLVQERSESGLQFDRSLPASEGVEASLRRELGASEALIQAFKVANATPTILRPGLDLPSSVSVLPSSYVAGFFDGESGGWDAFHKAHPGSGGIVRLSRVGVQSSEGLGLVYVGHHSGGLSAFGEFLLLQRVGGEWVVARRKTLWES